MSLRYDALTFEQSLERTEQYMTKIRDAGDLPWFEDPDRRAKVAARLGLPDDTTALEVRRALFERCRR